MQAPFGKLWLSGNKCKFDLLCLQDNLNAIKEAMLEDKNAAREARRAALEAAAAARSAQALEAWRHKTGWKPADPKKKRKKRKPKARKQQDQQHQAAAKDLAPATDSGTVKDQPAARSYVLSPSAGASSSAAAARAASAETVAGAVAAPAKPKGIQVVSAPKPVICVPKAAPVARESVDEDDVPASPAEGSAAGGLLPVLVQHTAVSACKYTVWVKDQTQLLLCGAHGRVDPSANPAPAVHDGLFLCFETFQHYCLPVHPEQFTRLLHKRGIVLCNLAGSAHVSAGGRSLEQGHESGDLQGLGRPSDHHDATYHASIGDLLSHQQQPSEGAAVGGKKKKRQQATLHLAEFQSLVPGEVSKALYTAMYICCSVYVASPIAAQNKILCTVNV